MRQRSRLTESSPASIRTPCGDPHPAITAAERAANRNAIAIPRGSAPTQCRTVIFSHKFPAKTPIAAPRQSRFIERKGGEPIANPAQSATGVPPVRSWHAPPTFAGRRPPLPSGHWQTKRHAASPSGSHWRLAHSSSGSYAPEPSISSRISTMLSTSCGSLNRRRAARKRSFQ